MARVLISPFRRGRDRARMQAAGLELMPVAAQPTPDLSHRPAVPAPGTPDLFRDLDAARERLRRRIPPQSDRQ
jgi:hypothetical protein